MPALSDPSYVRALLERHGLKLSKARGQNFLIDPTVCPRMAEACGAAPGRGVLEIGPGVGVLTQELCRRAEKVAAVEVDAGLIPVLAETMAGEQNLSVVRGDILKLDLTELLDREFGSLPVDVCANLPYYITTPILMLLLESRLPFGQITVMVQKEAAERLCARMGTRQAGAVTAAVEYFAEAEKLFEVPADSFYPPPKVNSAVMRLTLRREPPVQVADEKKLFRVVSAGFCQRRKTLPNALSSGLSVEKEAVRAALQSLGLSESVRAEALTLAQLAALADRLDFSCR